MKWLKVPKTVFKLWLKKNPTLNRCTNHMGVIPVVYYYRKMKPDFIYERDTEAKITEEGTDFENLKTVYYIRIWKGCKE